MMCTLEDIAKMAGVSKSTVSKALLNGGGKTTKISEKTAAKVKKIAAQVGYRPNLLAQRLSNKKNDVIGVIIDSECCSLYNNILIAFERCAFEANLHLQIGLVHDCIETINKHVNDFQGYRIENVLCMAHTYDCGGAVIPSLFKPFANTLFINKPEDSEEWAFISPDYYRNFYEAVAYLIESGYRRILYAKTAYNTFDMRVREQAYRDAHKHAAVKIDESLIYRKPLKELDNPESAELFLDDVLPHRPDALIIGNPTAINYCIRSLRRRGLNVPEDIAIIGMDDWKMADAQTPSISTIDNNYLQIAHEAIDYFKKHILEASQEKIQKFIPGKLIIRESSPRRSVDMKNI